jgi:hypothetical protein
MPTPANSPHPCKQLFTSGSLMMLFNITMRPIINQICAQITSCIFVVVDLQNLNTFSNLPFRVKDKYVQGHTPHEGFFQSDFMSK